MTVTLPKGGNLLLADEAPGISKLRVGLGWNPGQPPAGSPPLEMDVVVNVITETAPGGRLLLAQQVPNPEEPVGTRPVSGAVVGDVDKLVVNLDAAPRSLTRLLFGVAIYDAARRHQTFRPVHDAYIRIVNDENGIEVVRYTLEPETGAETALVFGELYRNPKGWKFRAVGQGYVEGLRGLSAAGASGSAEPQIARPVDVASFLTRSSVTRNRRSVADHLHPPATPLPTAPKPAPAPSPPAAPVKAAAPAVKAAPPPPAAQPRPPAASSSQPRRGLTPPAPAPKLPPAKAAPARSALDLSGPDEDAPAAAAAPGSSTVQVRRPGSRVVFGEHSSRYRQRQEHVTALDDDHPVTSWTEADRGSGGMTVTLRWEPLLTSNRLPRPSDIQLGCFWQAADREIAGVMQTLGNSISAPGLQGSRQVLRLGRRDEREGQTIFVDLIGLQDFRRFFVFAYGLHGSPEWEALRPELDVTAPTGERLTMRLGTDSPGARLCVIASFHVSDGDLVIRRENVFLDGVQADAAARFGWTLEWNPDGMTPRD